MADNLSPGEYWAPAPDAITQAVYRLLTARKEAKFWSFAKLGDRTIRHGDLTVGDCEQLVEQHVRAGTIAVQRYLRYPSAATADLAADHICRARLYRIRYLRLTGQPLKEELLPFPEMTQDEIDLQNSQEGI